MKKDDATQLLESQISLPEGNLIKEKFLMMSKSYIITNMN